MIESFDIMVKRISDFNTKNYEKDWRWRLLTELYHKNYEWAPLTNRKQHIPKKIHQIWLGGSLPEEYKAWTESWLKLNPDYEYKLWTDADVDDLNLPNRKAYDGVTNNGPKSDILRYHILNKFGGIYVDTDFECLKSFNDLSYLKFYTAVGYPSAVELYPGLIACIPHHPIIEKVTQEIDKVTNEDIIQKGILGATSSYFFTDVFFNIIKVYQKGLVAFPPDYFYPYPNNFKGFRNENGKSYIKDCSYAIHYWAQSWNKGNPEIDAIQGDWIQGDKFVKMADFVYAPNEKASDDYAKYPNTFDPAELRDVNIVYTNTMYLARFLRILPNLPQKFIVMSHNGDQHTDEGVIGTYANGIKIAEEPYILPDNVIRMYVQNVNVVHPRIGSIPLGLENSMWGTKKKEIMLGLMKRVKNGLIERKKLVYMNHSLNTRREERTMLYNTFGHLPWVTSVEAGKGQNALEDYFSNLTTHKFIMNPWGNCFDNHRAWEAWHLGCIPITRRCIFTSFYEDFPICLIDSWDEVTEEFLNKEYERITNLKFDKNKLTFTYWKTKVRTMQ
jgi:mannosyltransferase OCH1-like enzyme